MADLISRTTCGTFRDLMTHSIWGRISAVFQDEGFAPNPNCTNEDGSVAASGLPMRAGGRLTTDHPVCLDPPAREADQAGGANVACARSEDRRAFLTGPELVMVFGCGL
jgi:hypothetical protein